MSLLTRLLNVFRSKALEQEFDDELRFHLEERVTRNRERGMSQLEAELAAYRQFGSVEHAKHEMREMRMINRQFVGGLMAGLLLTGILAGLLWIGGNEPQRLVPQDRGFHAHAEASTICGVDVPAPRTLPPPGRGPVLLYLAPCFESQGFRSRVEPEVYLQDIHLQLSRPSQGLWIPYDAAAEKVILEDFGRLWSHHALADLSVNVRDYTFSNGVVGKLVTYNIKERS